jgi:hypothetical protein
MIDYIKVLFTTWLLLSGIQISQPVQVAKPPRAPDYKLLPKRGKKW